MPVKKGNKIIKQFEGDNAPENFEFPSIGIEDIDRAVFKLFDEKLNFQVTQKGEAKKVPVVFAAGERFALTRRKNPIRDKNNALILPIISIMRGDIDFSAEMNGKKTPISFREQPSYTIKKRLGDRDRNYQNVINKMGLTNQKNVSSRRNFLSSDIVPGNIAKAGSAASRRQGQNLTFKSQGGKITLDANLGNNIFEVIEVPYPEFLSITYDVVFWTQYLSQANEMIETLIVNFEGQGEEITMKTDGGYELVAFFKPSFSSNTNFDNYSDDERVIKHTMSFTVPGYIINPKHPGLPNLLRAYTSAPMIDFGYDEPSANVVFNNQPERELEKTKRHVLNDLTNIEEIRSEKRGETSEDIEQVIINPFTGEEEVLFSKVLSRDKRTGETVASALIVKKIERQYE
jgi:hypothetical protein